ncbi:MAG: cytochrome c [Pantoea sp.]|uniref:cytochrome c n=1 Tax=Pantoea sp. TaxID=69393 RepID=UPI002396830D|nr:cytochrome c [Pantoea sp.]MDE1188151.1 cytochrome c [Pantoea sp.]
MTKRSISVVFALLIVILGVVAWVMRTPTDNIAVNESLNPPSAELLKQGEYVARLSDCVACHSVPDGAPFAGGLKMATPVGNIYSTNITPDKETGIGEYTLTEFSRAVRHGVARDGHRLYPAMPYPSYAKLSDEDVAALYAWFKYAVKPVNQPNKPSDIPWPLNMRWPLAFWNSVFTVNGPWQPKSGQDAQWNRGAYLVEGPGHCGSCHTPRGLAFNEKGLDADSPHFVAGAALDGWYAPSLRGDINTGLARWSEDDLYQFLKTGRNQHGVVFGSMADVFNNSTQYMSDDDLKAIAHYLKSLPAGSNNQPQAWKYDGDSINKLSLPARLSTPGAQTFMARCSNCHGADGRGQAPWIPPLAGATSMLVDQSSAINVTLNGSARVVANGMPDAYRMPPFRKQLSDKEMADVLSFIRSSWGNTGVPVSEKDVHDLRQRTDPASSDVIILQMR